MSLFVLTAGDELYDCLLQAVPWDFAGKDFLLNALCIITMLLLNKPLLAYQFGISAQLKDVFDGIRVAREGNQTVSPAHLLAIKRFYRDAINSYLIYFGEIFDYDDLKDYADSLPGSGDSWADDFGFSRFHCILRSVSHFCAPNHWHVPFPEASESDLKLRDRAGFCYLKIFSASFIKIVSDLLGPMPSFESLLLFMTPKVLVTQDEIDELRIAYISSDHSWRMATMDEVAPGTVSFPAKNLMTSNLETLTHLYDGRHGRLRATERLGSRLRDSIQYLVFERALKILARAQHQEQAKPRLDENSEVRCESTLEKDEVDVVQPDFEEGTMYIPESEPIEVVREDHRLQPTCDRTLKFARGQHEMLKTLLRDKGERFDLASFPCLQLYYERGDLDESGQKPFEPDVLVDLWLLALRETTKDFKALQDSLSKRKVIDNEYYNQYHLNK